MRAKFLEKNGKLTMLVHAEDDAETILVRLFKQQTGVSTFRDHCNSGLQVTNGQAEIVPFCDGFYIRPEVAK